MHNFQIIYLFGKQNTSAVIHYYINENGNSEDQTFFSLIGSSLENLT